MKLDLTGKKGLAYVIPEGVHPARILEMKPDKTRDGKRYIKLVMSIVDGDYKGTKVIDQIYCLDGSEEQVEFQTSRLVDLCTATGNSQNIDGFTPFLNKIIEIRVAKKVYNGNEKAEVKAFRKFTGELEAPKAEF